MSLTYFSGIHSILISIVSNIISVNINNNFFMTKFMLQGNLRRSSSSVCQLDETNDTPLSSLFLARG